MNRAWIEAAINPAGRKPASPEVSILRRPSAAERWVERAIAAGNDPMARQQPLSGEDAGEWHIVTLKGSQSEAVPEELWDEVFVTLVVLGRVQCDQELQFWHGDFLAEDCSPQACAFRLRFARQALSLDFEPFYGTLGLDADTAQAVEAGELLLFPAAGNLDRLCQLHGFPSEWLAFGVAAEIEL